MRQCFDELEKGLTPKLVMEEASRCLLCLDAPCSKECPAGTDPAKFIRSVRFLNIKGAAETIRENNPLGSLCARLCPTEKYCQKGCLRSGIDRPIDIAAIQRFVTDYEAANNMDILKAGESNGKKVAIIGSGAGGLSAATKLAIFGYKVDIYEKEEKAGGMLRYGIPEYRLPEEVLDKEIKRITNLGVKILNNMEVGHDIAFEEIERSYDAVLVDIGFGKGKSLPVLGDTPLAVSALDLLKEIREGKEMNLPDEVIVIGGGDVAMDVAVSLKKLGVKRVVDVVYEEMSEFKASKKEKEIAFPLIDSLICGYIPDSMNGNKVKFVHRFLKSELEIEAKMIVWAIGQTVEVGKLPLSFEKGVIKQKDESRKVFFVGDLGKEDKTVVGAVRSGKMMAAEINAFLGGNNND